jgi:thiol:disulfide interchange protein DsbA
MGFMKQALAAASFAMLGMAATVAQASPQAPVNGSDYRTLGQAQPTEAPAGKVEVLEFFWYSCPHCFALDPSLIEWVKKQGNAISFKRVPVMFRPSFVPQQKLYYALETMNRMDLHEKVFHAIHADRKPLNTDNEITDFIAAQGVDKAKFLEVYNSFGVQTKVRRAAQLQEAYKIDGVPTLAIGGHYLTSPSIVGAAMGGNQPEPQLHSAALQVATWLVDKAGKEGSKK